MSRKGNLGWVAALLLAAAIVSLAVVVRDLEVPGTAPAPAAGGLQRNLPAASPAPAAPMNARLDRQMETLRQGLRAAGGTRSVAPSPAVRMAGFLLPVAGGALCGLAAGFAIGRRRAFRAPSVGVEEEADAARLPAEIERPSRSGAVADARLDAGWVEWICALESMTRQLARRVDELSSYVLDGRDVSRAASRRDSRTGGKAIGVGAIGGAGKAPAEATESTGPMPSVEPLEVAPLFEPLGRARSLAPLIPERPSDRPPEGPAESPAMSFAPTGSAEPVEPADPVEPGEPLEAPVRAAANRGSGSERVAGFALALGALKAGAGPGSLPAADRSRVRRAVRRLARDGWSDERIAQRLRLDPVEVERTLAPARTGVSN